MLPGWGSSLIRSNGDRRSRMSQVHSLSHRLFILSVTSFFSLPVWPETMHARSRADPTPLGGPFTFSHSGPRPLAGLEMPCPVLLAPTR